MNPKILFKPLYQRLLSKVSIQNATRLQFLRSHRYLPNFSHPKSFSERVCAMKLNWTDPRFIILSDKVLVKDWVCGKIGEDWVIPTLFVGSKLPRVELRNWKIPFIVKANHGSSMFEIVRSPADINWQRIDQRVATWMNSAWKRELCEEWYNHIKRQVLVEPLIGDVYEPPTDYKFFVFKGKIVCIQVDVSRFVNHTQDFYDSEWRRLPFKVLYPNSSKPLPKPKHFTEMCEAAIILGADFDFVRVDLYDLDVGPRFGEMTFAPWSGFARFYPAHFDTWLGKHWG